MAKKELKKKDVAKKTSAKSVTPSKKADKKVPAIKKSAPAKKVVTKVKQSSKKIVTAKKTVQPKSKPVPKNAAVSKKITKVKATVPKKAVKSAKISTTSKVNVKENKAMKTVTKTASASVKPSISVSKPSPIEKVKQKASGRSSKRNKVAPSEKPEIKTRPVVQKQLAKPISNGNSRKTEIVVPKIAKPIQIELKDRMPIKKQLLDKCLDIQTFIINNAKKAMDDAQQSANEEKNSNEDMSDSFRETMHATRDVYARQVQEGINTLGLLNRIIIKPLDVIKFGAVVITDFQNYFISAGLGEVKIDDKNFVTVSTLTPLYQILSEKKKGDLFMFLDRKYRILDVF
ncbi:MAG TPA: hypothetical protein VK766_02705 [Cytophagaceae bacterium]|jgi:hypothetical protein|nr:hypothetical protein [Cytophagaceae bacterium]